MFTDATSLWYTASNVIQSLNNNITSALESLDQELGENEERSDDDLYKKLLEDAQMQHFELSKQFRAIVSEKDAELAVWRKKCGELGNAEAEELQAEIDSAKQQAEVKVLRETVKNMENEIKTLLESSNETVAKLSRHNDLMRECEELRSRLTESISSSGELDAQKSGELEGLVAEYSKLAAEAETQKSSDGLRIRELELENEELLTKMRALEHSIGELADRSAGASSTPSSPQRAPTPPRAHAPIAADAGLVKELKARVVNLEYDIGEKEERISELTKELQTVRAELSRGAKGAEALVSAEELQSLQERISKTVDELSNAQQDVSRLQIEKQEAEAAGKSFHAQLRVLQKEVDAERAKGAVEAGQAAADSLQVRVKELEAELASAQDSCITKEAECGSLREEVKSLHAAVAAASEAAESSLSGLRTDNDVLQTQIETITASHAREMEAAHAATQELIASNSSELVQKTVDELTREKQKAIAEVEAKYAAQLDERVAEIARLEEDIAQLQASIAALKEEHANALAEQEKSLREEGDKGAESKVAAALAAAAAENEATLHEQKITLDAMAQEQRETALTALSHQHQTAMAKEHQEMQIAREEALKSLEADLKAASDERAAALTTDHEAALEKQRTESDVACSAALEEERRRSDEALSAARDEAKQEVASLIAAHGVTVEELNTELSSVKAELDSIEAIYKEKLQQQLDVLIAEKDTEKARALHELRCEMQSLVDAADTAREEFRAMYTKESKARKAIHNKLMDIQGNIRVLCRVRPILELELRSGEGVDVTEILSDEDIIISKDSSTRNRFEFDRVFSPTSTQEMVFEAVQPLVVSVLDGYNVCIFAYGQTGSGKTFTMEGYGSDIGVSPRAISELFDRIASVSDNWEYSVEFSTLEIYNESIRDLLDSSGKKDKLDVRQGPEGNQVVGLTEVSVSNPEQVHELMAQGQSNRAVGSHDMNEHSSRSHSILTLTCRGRNLRDGTTTFGKLHMIDLAGSERVGKTDATGDRLKEAQNINRSLSALGDVINSLGSKKATHVPYRNSKLTFLLQDSLGGNSKVLMFVNISPAVYNAGESVCSLNFASRCRNVELGQARKQSDRKALMPPPTSAPSSSSSAESSMATPAKAPSSGSGGTSASRRSTTGTPSVRK